MRVSVMPEDPGYTPSVFFCRVWLDGEEQFHVITADDELGYICRYVVEDGNFLVRNDHLLTENIYGKVTIAFNDQLNPHGTLQ